MHPAMMSLDEFLRVPPRSRMSTDFLASERVVDAENGLWRHWAWLYPGARRCLRRRGHRAEMSRG
jgi:hypothetical protein